MVGKMRGRDLWRLLRSGQRKRKEMKGSKSSRLPTTKN